MSTKQLPWFKCYQDKWLEDTRDLPPDLRGIYFDCLCLMYKYSGPLRDDPHWVSHQMHVSVRVWKRAREALIEQKFLFETPEGLVNKRASNELENRSEVQTKRQISGSKSRRKTEFNSENANEYNEADQANAPIRARIELEEEREEIEEKQLPSSSINPAPTDDDCLGFSDDELFRKLSEAAGDLLVRDSSSLGRLDVPKRWIREGCDLERDVLPSLRLVATRRPARSVRSWRYFSAEVMETKRLNTTDNTEIAQRKLPFAEQRQKRLQKLAALCGIEPREVAA
jgi:uncharacterized protein YdaU (DUF1376 family)